jgi:Secretion system C-terminal sorting domain
MRTIIIVLIFLYSHVALVGQDWQVIYNDSEKAFVFVDVFTFGSDIYATCRRYNEDTIQGITLFKYDSSGHVKDCLDIFYDSIILTTHFDFIGVSIHRDDIYIYGTVYETTDTYLIKTDTSLNAYEIFFYKSIDISAMKLFATEILTTAQGLFLISREQLNDQYLTTNASIIHTDFDGNIKWQKSYGLPGVEEVPICAVQKGKNEIAIGGGRSSPVNQPISFYQMWYHDWLLGIDTLGNRLWEWESPVGANRGGITGMSLINNKWYYSGTEAIITGIASFKNKPDITCRDSQFNLIWNTEMSITSPSDYNGYFSSSALSPDSTSMVAVTAYHLFNRPLTHFKVNLINGMIIYERQDSVCAPNSTFSYEGSLLDVAMLPSGSTVSCGFIDVSTPDGERVYGLLMKTNPWGIDLLDDCSTVSNSEPQYAQNELFIYPNPAIDHITIQTPEQVGAYRVRMYASTGALVREQVYAQGEVPEMQVRDLSSGLFFVQLLSENGQLLGVGKVIKV